MKNMEGKVIIFAAPSGTGKSTLVKYVMAKEESLNLHFSVSATSRPSREGETEGVDYFFLKPEEFEQKIAEGAFIEYEEVYAGIKYGTLKSQVDERLANGENIIFDVDVHGAMKIKEVYGKRALSIFVQPPSIEELRHRLEKRGTDTPERINERVERAAYELTFANKFDEVVLNDNLEVAQVEAFSLVEDFLAE
jgi:guanylate kinase